MQHEAGRVGDPERHPGEAAAGGGDGKSTAACQNRGPAKRHRTREGGQDSVGRGAAEDVKRRDSAGCTVRSVGSCERRRTCRNDRQHAAPVHELRDRELPDDGAAGCDVGRADRSELRHRVDGNADSHQGKAILVGQYSDRLRRNRRICADERECSENDVKTNLPPGQCGAGGASDLDRRGTVLTRAELCVRIGTKWVAGNRDRGRQQQRWLDGHRGGDRGAVGIPDGHRDGRVGSDRRRQKRNGRIRSLRDGKHGRIARKGRKRRAATRDRQCRRNARIDGRGRRKHCERPSALVRIVRRPVTAAAGCQRQEAAQCEEGEHRTQPGGQTVFQHDGSLMMLS